MSRHNEIRQREFEEQDKAERVRLGMMGAYLAEASGAKKQDGSRIQVWDIYPDLNPRRGAAAKNDSQAILAKFLAMSGKKVH